MTRQCVQCGREFARTRHDTIEMFARRRYCSRLCTQRAQRAPQRRCENAACGRVFRVTRHARHYCSRTCVAQAAMCRADAKVCEYCGARYLPRENESTRDFSRRKFCSAPCGQAGKRRGGLRPTIPRCQLGDCAWVLTTPGATRCTPGDGSPVCVRRQAEAA